MRFVNVIPFFPGQLEYLAGECRRIKAETGLDEVALCLILHPEGTPAIAKVEQFAADFSRFQSLMAGSGVNVGILLQSLLGHGWEGQPDTDENWQRTVNYTGKGSRRFCPLDKGFQQYLDRVMSLFVREKPSFFLVDDDFRLINNHLLECFCPLHLAKFSRQYTQKELIDLIVQAKPGDPLLEEFEEIRINSLLEAAMVIRRAIDRVDPAIRCGYCGPGREQLAFERIAKTLAGKTKPFIRIGNALYLEGNPKDFLPRMYHSALQVKSCGDIEEILDEADTFPQHCFSKSPVSMHAHICGGILHGLHGAKLWLTNIFHGDPAAARNYETILGDHQGFYRTLEETVKDIRYLGPVTPLVDLKCNYHPLHYPEYFTWNEWQTLLLNRYGIPGAFADASAPAEIRMLAGNMPDCFSDEELKLFLHDGLLLDGIAAEKLCARNFGEYLGVRVENRNFKFTYDYFPANRERLMLLNDTTVRHLTPLSAQTEILSELTDVAYSQSEFGHFVAPGTTFFRNALGGRVAVYASHLDLPLFSLMSPGHKRLLVTVLDRLGNKALPLVALDDQDLYFRLGELSGGGFLLAAINFNFSPLRTLHLRTNLPIQQLQELSPDGSWRTATCEILPDRLIIQGDFPIYQVNIFRIIAE